MVSQISLREEPFQIHLKSTFMFENTKVSFSQLSFVTSARVYETTVHT